MSSKICQYAALTSAWAWTGTLASTLRARVDQTALAYSGREGVLDRADQPRCAVGDDQHRRPQPSAGQVGEEIEPGVVAFAGRWGQTEEHRAAGGCDPVGDQDRLGPGAGVVAKAGPIQYR
jgi:hypothetical protein